MNGERLLINSHMPYNKRPDCMFDSRKRRNRIYCSNMIRSGYLRVISIWVGNDCIEWTWRWGTWNKYEMIDGIPF